MARVPSLEFAQRADTTLGTPGTFARMQLHLRAAPFPSWFRPFAQHEQDATALRTFEHSLVPGLLQVPEYARALLSTRMGTSQDEDRATGRRADGTAGDPGPGRSAVALGGR